MSCCPPLFRPLNLAFCGVEPVYDFSQRGGWDLARDVGNVQLAPAWIYDIVIDSIDALWQSDGRPTDLFITKNHMAWRLYFANATYSIYKGAILSMEVDFGADEDDTFPEISSIPVCGEDYCPGIFTLRMLDYSGPTRTAVHSRKYATRPGSTLGQFIRSILERQMHRFLFHMYTPINAFKGCGHFCVVAYLAWINDDLIVDPKSTDSPHRTFPEDVVFTYLPNGASTEALVGRGQFLDLIELDGEEPLDEPHALAPFQIYAQGHSRYNRVLAGQDVDAENETALEVQLGQTDNLV